MSELPMETVLGGPGPGSRILRRDTLHRVEIGLLLALALALPALETPKTILWIAYAACWLVNRTRSGDFGGRWRLSDTVFAGLMVSAVLSTAFPGIQGQQFKGLGEAVAVLIPGWLVSRARYTPRESWALLLAFVLGVLPALAFGYWQLYGSGAREFLELNSVGHVNHSAIYVAILLGSAWFLWRGSAPSALKSVLAGVVALFAISLIIMGSRATLGATAATAIAGVVLWRGSFPLAMPSRRVLVGGLAVLAGLAALIALSPSDRPTVPGAFLFAKFHKDVANGEPFSFRDRLANTALAAAERFPLFGVGIRNFRAIDADAVRSWRADAGDTSPAIDRYFFIQHAHSVYFNTLAERGIVGLVALLALLLLWAGGLVTGRPRAGTSAEYAAQWGASLSALGITAVNGILNTTLQVEHGILLALILFGLWLPAREGAATDPHSGAADAAGSHAEPMALSAHP